MAIFFSKIWMLFNDIMNYKIKKYNVDNLLYRRKVILIYMSILHIKKKKN